MEDETAAPAARIRIKTNPYIPHEVVTEILLRLPVTSLLRFRCVSKAWHATMSNDPSFQCTHLRRHRTDDPCLLIAPRIHAIGKNFNGSLTGLYQWEEDDAYGTATALLYPMPEPPFPNFLEAHDLAHCDGLVLVGTRSAAWVPNPVMRRVVELPWGRLGDSTSFSYLEAFGLGHDPHSDAYKVVRFFTPPRVEVLTIGSSDRCWHETVSQPPWFHVKRRPAAICFKGSLIWTVDQKDRNGQLGFLRFRLDEETFSLIPPPPCWSWDDHEASTLSDLREVLCLTTSVGLMNRSLDMWICTDLDLPQWEKCYNILSDWTQPLHPVAMLGNGVLVCRSSGNYLHRCTFQPGKVVTVNHTICMNDLRYDNLDEDTLVEYPRRTATYFDAIPYVPSFVLI